MVGFGPAPACGRWVSRVCAGNELAVRVRAGVWAGRVWAKELSNHAVQGKDSSSPGSLTYYRLCLQFISSANQPMQAGIDYNCVTTR